MTKGISIVMGALIAGCLSAPIRAQTTNFPVYQQSMSIVSINREQLIQQSEYGRALIGSLSKQQTELAAENETLLKDLEREELELTGLRKTMSSEEFRPLADAFDAKVRGVRQAQDQKLVDLAKALENARFRFFRQAEGVIAKIMQENDIVFVLDENVVWLSRGGDVTELVINRLNAAYGAGELPLE